MLDGRLAGDDGFRGTGGGGYGGDTGDRSRDDLACDNSGRPSWAVCDFCCARGDCDDIGLVGCDGGGDIGDGLLGADSDGDIAASRLRGGVALDRDGYGRRDDCLTGNGGLSGGAVGDLRSAGGDGVDLGLDDGQLRRDVDDGADGGSDSNDLGDDLRGLAGRAVGDFGGTRSDGLDVGSVNGGGRQAGSQAVDGGGRSCNGLLGGHSGGQGGADDSGLRDRGRGRNSRSSNRAGDDRSSGVAVPEVVVLDGADLEVDIGKGSRVGGNVLLAGHTGLRLTGLGPDTIVSSHTAEVDVGYELLLLEQLVSGTGAGGEAGRAPGIGVRVGARDVGGNVGVSETPDANGGVGPLHGVNSSLGGPKGCSGIKTGTALIVGLTCGVVCAVGLTDGAGHVRAVDAALAERAIGVKDDLVYIVFVPGLDDVDFAGGGPGVADSPARNIS